MLIDIHSHHFYKRDTLIKVVSIDITKENFSDYEFFENSGLYLSIGIHPWSASNWKEEHLVQLEKHLLHPGVLFVGEIGLDKQCEISLFEQSNIFDKQLNLASKYRKPVILHSVRTIAEMLSYKLRYPLVPGWIIHGFRGKPNEAELLLKKGFYLSFGHRFNLKSLLTCPNDRLFFESDTSTKEIQDLYLAAADVKNCTLIELENRVQSNFEIVTGTK